MNNSETLSTNTFRITPRLIVGFGILALGLLWTLDNIDVLESEPITRWWPVLLIVIGVIQLLDRHASRFGAGVLIVVGTVLVLKRAHLVRFDLSDLIPLLFAVLGAKLIWEAVTRRRAPEASDSESIVHAFAMMAGIKRLSSSTDFRGGDANAIMGGVELDLRNAQVVGNEPVIIDTFAFWGAVEVIVPPHWKVEGRVLPLMGGFVDNTKPTADPGPRVIIRGTAVMGAVEVKN